MSGCLLRLRTLVATKRARRTKNNVFLLFYDDLQCPITPSVSPQNVCACPSLLGRGHSSSASGESAACTLSSLGSDISRAFRVAVSVPQAASLARTEKPPSRLGALLPTCEPHALKQQPWTNVTNAVNIQGHFSQQRRGCIIVQDMVVPLQGPFISDRLKPNYQPRGLRRPRRPVPNIAGAGRRS